MPGMTPAKDRTKVVNAFNKAKVGVLIGQIRTGGLGIDLTGCNTVIYYSNTWSLEDRLQSEDRCHRIGQKNKVTYIDIIGRDTVEESVNACLKKKQGIADIVTDPDKLNYILEGKVK